MNDSDVSKQVQQMVHFIKQEAEEKANEISVAAEEVNPGFCFLIRSGKMERKQKTKKQNEQMLLGVVVEWWRNGLTKIDVALCELVRDWTDLAYDWGLQEFNIEKLQLVEAEKKKIKQEYERKEKQVDVRKKM